MRVTRIGCQLIRSLHVFIKENSFQTHSLTSLGVYKGKEKTNLSIAGNQLQGCHTCQLWVVNCKVVNTCQLRVVNCKVVNT